MNKIRNINKNKTVYSIDIFSEFRRKPREFVYLPEYDMKKGETVSKVRITYFCFFS